MKPESHTGAAVQDPYSYSNNEAALRNNLAVKTRAGKDSVASLAHNGNVVLAAHSIPPHLSAAETRGRRLADKDLTGLYQSIETALAGQECRIVQFASCYHDEGAKTIAMELSIFAARAIGQRTLFIGMENTAPVKNKKTAGSSIASLNDVANGRAEIDSAIAESPDAVMHCDYAYIAFGQEQENILGYIHQLQQILTALRAKYDLIVFHAPGILANPLGISLGRLADGVVFVVEAERTRAPAAQQALRHMREKGVRVLGLAFNKRRYYIPRWLYRAL